MAGTDDIRFMECGHSTEDHTPDEVCLRRRDNERAERERLAKYGPCPYCEYGLHFPCNHPEWYER